MTTGPELCVATLNVRNTADRWHERRHLLVRQLIDLAPELIGLQELRIVPDQGAWIAREVERRSCGRLRYRCYRRSKTGRLALWEGIGVLSRVPAMATASLDLGSQRRVAQRVTVRVPGGGVLDVYNTHLGVSEDARLAQARRIAEWMGVRPPVPALLIGDLNARPGSPTIELLLSTGLRSAHPAAHGQEPARTVPTPLRVGVSGPGSVLDYVFVNDRVGVREARLAFDEADLHEPTLAASDHYGLAVTLTLSGCCSPASPGPRPH